MTTIAFADPTTFASAVCAQIGYEDYYPGANEHVGQSVIDACQSCPVLAECRELARAADQQYGYHGMWAGLTPSQRRRQDRGLPFEKKRAAPVARNPMPCPACGKVLSYDARRAHVKHGCPQSKPKLPERDTCTRCGRYLSRSALNAHAAMDTCPPARKSDPRRFPNYTEPPTIADAPDVPRIDMRALATNRLDTMLARLRSA